MEDPPRVQPVVSMRAGTQSRTSKLVQKLSNLRSRIRLSSVRKGSVDLALEGPYRQSTSVGARMAKPYMSQPILAMPNPYNIQQRRGADESPSPSPSSSHTGTEPCSAPVPPKRTRHSVSTAVVTGTNTGVVFTGKGITFDGLSSQNLYSATNATNKHTSGLPIEHSRTMEGASLLPPRDIHLLNHGPLSTSDTTGKLASLTVVPAAQASLNASSEAVVHRPNIPFILTSSPGLSLPKAAPHDHEESLSFASTSTNSFHTPPSHSHSLHGGSSSCLPTTSIALSTQTMSTSRPSSRGNNSLGGPSILIHDTNAMPDSSTSPTDALTLREGEANTYSVSQPSMPVSGLLLAPASSPLTRSVFNGSSNLDSGELASFVFPPPKNHNPLAGIENTLPLTPPVSSSPRLSTPSLYGTTPTRRTPPSLPMPLRRFSMTLPEGAGSARLSPSLITRHPPMPILNLPTLPPSSTSSNAAALNSNANKPHQKLRSMPALPRQGTNIDEDEDDEEDDDGEDTENGDDFVEASDGGDDDDDRTAEDGPSLHLPIDLARLDLSFLDNAPRSPDLKGKGKQKEDSDLASATPTASKGKGLPTPREQPFSNDYFSVATPSGPASKTPSAAAFSPVRTPRLEDGMQTPGSPRRHMVDGRPTIYKHASRSMINIVGPSLCRRDEQKEAERENEIEIVPRTTGLVGVVARLPPSTDKELELSSPVAQLKVSADTQGTLHRRRSLPTFTAGSPPPPYPSFAPFKGFPISSHQAPPDFDAPHRVEGRETLPEYSNSIYLRTVMPRKMEFTQPGVQAKDRKWRRVVCELEGTVFRVYECPREAAGVSAIGLWWEKKVGVGDASIPATSGPASTKVASDTILGDRTEPVSKLGEVVTDAARGGGETDLELSPESPVPSQQEPQQTFMHSNQSRSKLASLLKPSRPLSRSRSDVPSPPRLSTPSQPRSSLSTPRPRTPTVAISSSPSDSSLTISTPSSLSSLGSSPRHRSSSSRSHFRPGRTPAPSIMSVPELPEGELIRAYTLQNAESGLGNDYLKRKNVIRVRMEGEQFLLQAMNVACVVEWIEGLHSATNVSLDLDERPMPRGPLFPRRRRRRAVRRTETTTVSGTTTNTLSVDAQPPAQTT